MAWTSPATWSAGAVLTAAQLNSQVRDNFKAIGDTWTAFGSGASWTASVNPALGNGAWDASYMKAGKLVSFSMRITMGSTTTYGSGTWQLTLPFTAAAGTWIFQGIAIDSSTSEEHLVLFRAGSSTTLLGRALPTTAGNQLRPLTATVPFTWANGDELFLSGRYQSLF